MPTSSRPWFRRVDEGVDRLRQHGRRAGPAPRRRTWRSRCRDCSRAPRARRRSIRLPTRLPLPNAPENFEAKLRDVSEQTLAWSRRKRAARRSCNSSAATQLRTARKRPRRVRRGLCLEQAPERAGALRAGPASRGGVSAADASGAARPRDCLRRSRRSASEVSQALEPAEAWPLRSGGALPGAARCRLGRRRRSCLGSRRGLWRGLGRCRRLRRCGLLRGLLGLRQGPRRRPPSPSRWLARRLPWRRRSLPWPSRSRSRARACLLDRFLGLLLGLLDDGLRLLDGVLGRGCRLVRQLDHLLAGALEERLRRLPCAGTPAR